MQLKIANRAFSEKDIRSLQINTSSPLTLSEIESDSLFAVVMDTSTNTNLLSSGGMLLSDGGHLLAAQKERYGADHYGYGSSVLVEFENQTYLFFSEEIKKTASNLYSVDAVSDIGMLKNGVFYGGVYNGVTLSRLLNEIIGSEFAYAVDDSIKNQQVYGFIPKTTKKEALHNVLFAMGVTVERDSNWNAVFVPVCEKSPAVIGTPYENGSAAKLQGATKVSVVEHGYYALDTDETVTLYDGEAAAAELVTPNGAVCNGVLVDFSDPMYDLEAKNTSILESGANYAVISGSPAAVLTGKKYTHTMRTLSKAMSSDGKKNEYSVSNCFLVNLMNAENVLTRVSSYLSGTKQFSESFILQNEKAGDFVSFTDPFGEESTGFIEKMDVVCSSIKKATATITSGYIPTAWGNYYTAVAEITQSGTFTVPDECRGKIRIVLIQGGGGGYAGEPGGAGTDGDLDVFGTSGEGGAGGSGGSPGRVYVGTIAAKAGDTFTVVIGTGGAGAAASGEAPEEGGHTTFGGYSSADGYLPDEGYAALLTDAVYAMPGEAGTPGGAGQRGRDAGYERPTVTFDGETWTAGAQGETASTGSVFGGGGLGGGAAVGADGGNGGDGSVSSYNGGYLGDGGDGGDGATPIAAPDTDIPGQGGHGGHGGGGAGGGGAVSGGIWVGAPGTPGGGGRGGTGGPGLVLVYY